MNTPVPVLVLREITITTYLSGSSEPRRARIEGDAVGLLELLGQPNVELGNTQVFVVQVSTHVVRVSLYDGTPVARLSVDTEEAGATIVFVDNTGWLQSLLEVGAEPINPETWPGSWIRVAYKAED